MNKLSPRSFHHEVNSSPHRRGENKLLSILLKAWKNLHCSNPKSRGNLLRTGITDPETQLISTFLPLPPPTLILLKIVLSNERVS